LTIFYFSTLLYYLELHTSSIWIERRRACNWYQTPLLISRAENRNWGSRSV